MSRPVLRAAWPQRPSIARAPWVFVDLPRRWEVGIKLADVGMRAPSLASHKTRGRMNNPKMLGMSCVVAAICALPLACSVGTDPSESVDGASQAVLPPGQCNQAVAKDVLIAQLVKDSWVAAYPLTRLYADASGAITGPSLPDLLIGDLDLINSITEARESVARALVKVTGLPEYVIQGIGAETEACMGIPAWTPSGPTTVNTTSIEVIAGPVNHDSWRDTQKEFGKECPLIKRIGNKDIVDPPGDGSTNDPPSATVSASGVTANAFGICPTGTTTGTFCKLGYATGINYTGRSCQVYYGSLRCLLY